MLPDFLKTKEKLKKMLNSEMKKAQLAHLGPLAASPVLRMFEGNKSIIVHEDSSTSEMNPRKMVVELEIELEEIEEMNHAVVLNKINAMTKEMAEKQEKLSYEVIGKAAKKVGNVTTSSRGTLSIDSLLEALEKIHIDFDEKGQPSGLMLVSNPETPIDKAVFQAADDPRYQALMERKREEWRVRENNRKLVG